jgi:hypothetical protein
MITLLKVTVRTPYKIKSSFLTSVSAITLQPAEYATLFLTVNLIASLCCCGYWLLTVKVTLPAVTNSTRTIV